MPVQIVGRTTDFCGKTLWEIVGNLKNHGKDRLIIRQRFQRYPEPCFMKILKVGALPVEIFRSPKHEVMLSFIATVFGVFGKYREIRGSLRNFY